MALTLHYHPLSSCCWKALIALYEMQLAFEPRLVNLGDTAAREAFHALWPAGKIPLLADGDEIVPETSIMIEHLSLRHASPERALIPADARSALEVRLMDRLLDFYVMTPMQAITADRLRAPHERDPIAVDKARATLAMAYGMLEGKLEGRAWAAGDAFTLADCAAAPSLFYAAVVAPFAPQHRRLAAYFERLIERPSVARVLNEAQPFFPYYPFHDALPARFLQSA